MTFAEYITQCRAKSGPRGDFIADAKASIRDNTLPDVRCWADLYRFLTKQSACDEAVMQARKVWREYQRANSLETVQ